MAKIVSVSGTLIGIEVERIELHEDRIRLYQDGAVCKEYQFNREVVLKLSGSGCVRRLISRATQGKRYCRSIPEICVELEGSLDAVVVDTPKVLSVSVEKGISVIKEMDCSVMIQPVVL